MIRKSLAAAVVVTAAVGISIAPTILAEGESANEIKVLSANGMKAVLGDLLGNFERTTGHKVTISFGEAGEIRKRIQDGEVADSIILPRPVMEELLKQGKIADGTTVDIARTAVGMGVRTNAPKPDVSSVEGFKRSLLAAKSIVITDPATGGVSGVHFAGVLQRLGIAEQVRPKLKLNKGSYNAEFVARGEAEIAIQLAHEIRAVTGVEFVPLPAAFQRTIVFSAGVGVSAKEPEAPKMLIQFLSGPAAAPVITAKGMEPA